MAACLVEKKADQKETVKSKEIRLVPMKDGLMVEGLAFLTATLKVEGSVVLKVVMRVH